LKLIGVTLGEPAGIGPDLGVLLAQKKHVKNRLGSDLYDRLEADIVAGTLTGNYKILVDDYISEMLVHWSFYESIPFLRLV
jgi:hypothetical protein